MDVVRAVVGNLKGLDGVLRNDAFHMRTSQTISRYRFKSRIISAAGSLWEICVNDLMSMNIIVASIGS